MSSDTAGTKFCSNCKKDIAVANFTMHEVHCKRHLELCPLCQEPVPRTEKDEHFKDVHAKVPCAQCSLEMEKVQMESHLKNYCLKRQVHCEYCELQLPHSELAAHVEFCGTRTESCPLCKNFIMHKDLEMHNNSNCAYPEMKPPPPSTNGFGDRSSMGMFGGGFALGEVFGGMDSHFARFQFDQIRRAIDGLEQGVLAEDSDASALAGEEVRGIVPRGSGMRQNQSLLERKKNDAKRGVRKETTNKRSEVNRHRQQDSPPAIPPDIDYDTMLAMQIAEEDNDVVPVEADPDDHINQLLSSFAKRSSLRERSHRTPLEEEDLPFLESPTVPRGFEDFSASDEDMIPCEFCKETFPAFALVHHQSVCDPLASGLWGQLQDTDVLLPLGQNNTSHSQAQPSPNYVAARPPPIPVINNLRSASPVSQPERKEEVTHHLTDNGDHFLNSLENIMLPCEFCNDLLPADSLVQHQAMCESSSQTSRVMIPATQPAVNASPSPYFPTDNSFRHRQDDPTEGLLASLGVLKKESLLPKKQPNLPVIKPGAFTVTRAPAASRPIERSRRGHDEQDVSLHGRGTRQGERESAARSRHLLDSLLSDDVPDDRHSGQDAGDSDTTGRHSQGSSRRTPRVVSGVSSRTVLRALEQQDRAGTNPSRNQGNSREGTESFSSRTTQRERGDHMFNSTGNTRSQGRQRKSNQPDRN